MEECFQTFSFSTLHSIHSFHRTESPPAVRPSATTARELQPHPSVPRRRRRNVRTIRGASLLLTRHGKVVVPSCMGASVGGRCRFAGITGSSSQAIDQGIRDIQIDLTIFNVKTQGTSNAASPSIQKSPLWCFVNADGTAGWDDTARRAPPGGRPGDSRRPTRNAE